MPLRLPTIVAAALALAVLSPAASAQIPNTGPGADPEAGFGFVEGAPNVLTDRLLASPFNPSDPDPAEAAATAALWSPGTPENDLADALDDLASAPSTTAAADARALALDILEGNPIAKKAYSGIPLLNWNAPDKVKTVPAGGTVTVTQVRWGEHMISDTWLLQFADPDQPFKIKYRIAELGSAAGGQLNPTPLLTNGTGQHSAIQPLAIEPNIDLGTHQGSRFTDDRGLGDVPEQTRRAIQEITVAMPPPRDVSAILDPNLRPGHETATTLLPATPERLAGAADKATAIGRLADASPEKQIWSALKALDAGDLAAAHAAGEQNRPLVGAMRSRTELPAGIVPDAQADATVVLQNNEAYLTNRKLRLEPGATLRVQVVNRDGFSHHLTAFDLSNRDRIFGAWDWGRFDWTERALLGGSTTLGPDASRTFTIDPAASAFSVWIGDLDSGDQANASIALDREIKMEALRFGAGTSPIHSAPDNDGNVWVTLAGVDAIVRIRPAAHLADSTVDRFPLPGGRPDAGSPIPPLVPSDVTVDGRGIVWSTLASGNAIARLDPDHLRPGSTDGIKILKLEPCPVTPQCIPIVPPVPNELPTRRPTRIKTLIDGQGNTVVWYAEVGTASIGVLRVSADGEQLEQAHFSCQCTAPESMDLGPDGSIWYAEIVENRIGRLRPDLARPLSPSAARMDHYNIPSSTLVESPPLHPRLMTALPLSVAVDGRGRVWFSESSMSSVAYLEPDKAKRNTTQGFTELARGHSAFRSPAAPADVTIDRANNFWWAGEYGDQIEQVEADDTTGLRFRSSARRGLTEGPISDRAGNLWIVETGGNLITRISGVTSGPLLPEGLPTGFEANTTSDAVTGVRLRDTTSVDVSVVRGDQVVARASAPVAGGSFSIAGADWNGASDAVHADDTVRVERHGPFARAALEFTVAGLSAAVDGDGAISGTALVGDQALSDKVEVDYSGGSSGHGSGRSQIDGGSGRWKVTPEAPLPPDASGSVAWSNATVAASFRTVTGFGPPAKEDAPATSDPTAPPVAPKKPGIVTPRKARSTACTRREWLHGTRRAPKLLLLGLTKARLERCLGKPTAKTATRWYYGRGLAVTLRHGRVVGFTLADRRFRSARGKVGVGSSMRALRKMLPRLKTNRVTIGRARLRVTVDRRGRIKRIIVVMRGSS